MAARGRIARICLALSVGVSMTGWYVAMTAANAAAAPLGSLSSIATPLTGQPGNSSGNGGFEWG
jgi:hypothetical protein